MLREMRNLTEIVSVSRNMRRMSSALTKSKDVVVELSTLLIVEIWSICKTGGISALSKILMLAQASQDTDVEIHLPLPPITRWC